MTADVCIDGRKEAWLPGEVAHFEYHCTESDDSADAELWYHSHQLAYVVFEEDSDAWDGSTMDERADAGQLKVYKVRFCDGREFTAFEDELLTTPLGFYRPDPPGAP